MKRKFGVAFVFAILLINCSTEKINLSPVSGKFNDDISSSEIGNSAEAITYQSELTNLTSTFPNIKNSSVNKEVSILKDCINKYVAASISKSQGDKKSAYKCYSDSYKKIQKLRKYLNMEQDEVLNRYLVRIKTNVNLLESLN